MAILVVAAAAALRGVLGVASDTLLHATFYPAVALTAYLGGIRAGLVSVVLSGLAANYFFIQPYYRLAIWSRNDFFGLCVFAIFASSIVFLIGALRRSAIRYRVINNALQAHIREQARQKRQEQEQKRLVELMAASAPLEVVLVELLRFIEAQEPGMRSAIFLATGDGQYLREIPSPSFSREYALRIDGALPNKPPYFGPCAEVADRGGSILVGDLMTETCYSRYWRDMLIAEGIHTVRSTGIYGREGRLLGSLGLYFDRHRDPTPKDPELVDIATHLAAIAIERHLADQRLRESEQRYRDIYENAALGISIASPDGRIQACNPAYAAMHGYSEEELQNISYGNIVHPEDRERHAEQLRRLVSGEVSSFEINNRCTGKGGRLLWVQKHVSLLRDESNQPVNIIALVTDITDRKRSDEQIQFLMREVNHRSKNLLTIVQAIARQTASTNPKDFLRRFDTRVAALAASQDLLVKNEWKGADLADLVRSQLAHLSDGRDGRVTLAGPPLLITASAAQSLGLTFHELATNAGKYGALSNDAGRVEVQWSIERGVDGQETFTIDWRESDGPAVEEPSATGFGSTVISRMAELSLEAKVDLDYLRSGVQWRLRCPMSEVIQHHAVGSFDGGKSAATSQSKRKEAPRVLVVEDEAVVALEVEQRPR